MMDFQFGWKIRINPHYSTLNGNKKQIVIKPPHAGAISCLALITKKYFDMLHSFLFETVYKNPIAKSEETKVLGIVSGIFEYYLKNTDKLPEEYKNICNSEGLERAVADYIAGMTDHYAVTVYSNIYIPKFWSI